jgi:FG-GAP-like repeat
LVDLDGDGINDVLSGSWPGELFFFRGKGKVNGVVDFHPAVKLKGKNGKTINIGGGVERRDDGVLVTGDGKFEQKDGKTFIVYEGEWIEARSGSGITGTASAVHAHDFDGDGDLDLVVGDIRGNVFLVPNEGSKTKWSFGAHQNLKAGGQDLRVQGGDAGPFFADWDADGKTDLLVGGGDGSVWLYRNTAAGKGTELAAGRQLVPPAGDIYGANTPAVPTRGMRAKVCAADWNGDGRLDLLLGDFTYQKPNRPPPTAAEQAEIDKVRAALVPVEKRYQDVARRQSDPQARKKMSPAEREQLQKEWGEVYQEMWGLRQKLPPESENHGWVWLFLRKPGDQANAAGR